MERFKGKMTTITKSGGHLGVVESSSTPINKVVMTPKG
jgi:hypothetical protein